MPLLTDEMRPTLPPAEHGMCTPNKSHLPNQSTPRRSERKRALFPTASPQTSDLGHMSPLGSSPDRYSSAPPSPESLSPSRPTFGSSSPFGRKCHLNVVQRVSPRRRFSELFGSALVGRRESWRPNSVVPVDQLEQTVLSVMEESDGADSPQSHSSQHTPSTTARGEAVCSTASEMKSVQPLTPSKRRLKCLPISGSGSTTSTSPQSPKRLESESKRFALLPRARLSLFSEKTSTKKEQNDGIYLTGRSSKSKKAYGQINAGVRTGIRRPPKSKPKKETCVKKTQGKNKYIGDKKHLSSRKTSKKNNSMKLPKLRLAPQQVKLSDKELMNFSASASVNIHSKKCSSTKEDKDDENESTEHVDPKLMAKRKFFKTNLSKKRIATLTVNRNVKIAFSQGKFTVLKSSPTPKRKRRLFNQKKQIEQINNFEDNTEDVAKCVDKEVQIILKKLDEEGMDPNSSNANQETSSKESLETNERCVSTSPLSPLSELASSTSTLSLSIGGDTLHLKESHVQALSQVPDLIMEEDDELYVSSPKKEKAPSQDYKENGGDSVNIQNTPTDKFFPIFNCTSQDKSFSVSEELAAEKSKKRKRTWHPIGNDQYQIDAGQKKFGATECSECRVVYQLGDPEDEIEHTKFHDSCKLLRHDGWKQENIIGEFGLDYVIVIKPGDPKLWWTRVMQLMTTVDEHLGFVSGTFNSYLTRSLVYLYVSKRHIIGCLVAQPLKTANRMLLNELETGGIDCCSKEEYPVKCGVSRIWVHKHYRHRHVASNLMDCMRKNFLFGGFLRLEDVAFSSPSSSGKIFAEKYTGRKDFFVYLQT